MKCSIMSIRSIDKEIGMCAVVLDMLSMEMISMEMII